MSSPSPSLSCRICRHQTWTADVDGPVHECCWTWQHVIAAGQPCPVCQLSRAVLAQDPAKPVRLPNVSRLPDELPDGTPYVPRPRPPGEQAVPVSPDRTPGSSLPQRTA